MPKILKMFTHITHKFELRSCKVRHSVIPLLTPSLEASISRRTILYSLRDPTWRTTTTCSQQSYGKPLTNKSKDRSVNWELLKHSFTENVYTEWPLLLSSYSTCTVECSIIFPLLRTNIKELYWNIIFPFLFQLDRPFLRIEAENSFLLISCVNVKLKVSTFEEGDFNVET